MKKIILVGLAFVFANQINAQSTTATNIWASGRYLGYSGNNPLEFRTNNTLRISLNENVTNNINSQGNAVRNGYVGIGQSYVPMLQEISIIPRVECTDSL